ncbi:Peptidase M16 domain-containing protein [Rozella allomycis CSF55]|uniref:Peptidase M16 domain-containing protein n=1 Tax=Rozella allomycis (strain CSF55) TaxID=988480 RepID=A0A075ARH4_ROZAC|nr:Peptidase M16 domain-containing protein [Rozella allomycis CSF55]|eukprot:EPZ31092.1 Peptidase M16 domain-containing protein [Rozella allomycis CSF55]
MTFKLLNTFSLEEFDWKVKQFAHEKYGLKIVIIDLPAPTVNGHFVLATEAHDDDGCPHVLEHLVFLGSHTYPYKGVLDSIANRSFAQGTNAWTDTDHTCYTIATAGSEGFLQILPVYLDHILFPTITEAGFYTEVHHINGKGHNAGVVYCEMQGRQNSNGDLIHHKMLNLLYPEGCGYRSETGGKMENLRVLHVNTVREYHKKFYRPENLNVIITGKVEEEKLFEKLQPLIEQLDAKYRDCIPEYQRPWIESGDIPDLKENIVETLNFPDEDESVGTVVIGWHGWGYKEHLLKVAFQALTTYLTDSAVSPLQKTFVELEEPYCSDVTFGTVEAIKSSTFVEFSNVPVENIDEIEELLIETLSEMEIDMGRMQTVLERSKLILLEQVETSPHSSAALPCVGDFLYGDRNGSELVEVFRDLEFTNELMNWQKENWKNLIEEYLLQRPRVVIKGVPSKAHADLLSHNEKTRLEEQIKELGPEKLNELEAKLEECKKINEIPIPREVFDKFVVPKIKDIKMHKTIAGSIPDIYGLKNDLQERLNNEVLECELPFASIQFDSTSTKFVDISIGFETGHLTGEERLYLEIFLDLFFEVDVEDGNEIIDYETVIENLQKETVSYATSCGLNGDADFSCGDFADFVVLTIKGSIEKYEKLIYWMKMLLFHSKYSSERIMISAQKIINEIPEYKRDAMKIISTAQTLFHYIADSNQSAVSLFKQDSFAKTVSSNIKNDASVVEDAFNAFVRKIVSPERMMVYIVADHSKLNEIVKPWSRQFPNLNSPIKLDLNNIPRSQLKLSEFGKDLGNRSFLIKMPSIESTYAIHVCNGPSDYNDPDIPALLVLHEYLSTMEGPFWKQIRGQGLAYSCSINVSTEAGNIKFTIYRAPDAFKAFNAAKQILLDIAADPLNQLDDFAIESTKSSVLFGFIASQETQSQAAFQAFVDRVLKKRDLAKFMAAIQNVTKEDMARVLKKYTLNLFDSNSSDCFVASTPNMFSESIDAYKSFGFDVKSYDKIEDLASL